MAVDPITSDGLLLLQRFKEKESVNFSDFLATWNELNFPLIYWYVYVWWRECMQV